MPENDTFPEASTTEDAMIESVMDEKSDWIEAYLDGELSEIEARRVERRALTDPSFAAELELARKIQSGLRSLSLPCPSEVMDRVEAEIVRPSAWALWRRRFFALARPWSGESAWRPALVTAAVALAMAAFFTATLPQVTPPQTAVDPPQLAISPQPTEMPNATTGITAASDVEAARREVELALAYLGKLGRTAESSVRRLRTEAPGSGEDAI